MQVLDSVTRTLVSGFWGPFLVERIIQGPSVYPYLGPNADSTTSRYNKHPQPLRINIPYERACVLRITFSIRGLGVFVIRGKKGLEDPNLELEGLRSRPGTKYLLTLPVGSYHVPRFLRPK